MQKHLVSVLSKVTRFSVLLVVPALLVGCSSSDISDIEDLQTVSVFSRSDQLSRTMEYIQSLERYEMNEFRDKVNSGLNRWIQSADIADVGGQWQRSPILDRVPPHTRDSVSYIAVDSEKYSAKDANYIQQAHWLKVLVDRIRYDNRIWSFQPYFQVVLRDLDQAERESLGDSDDLLTETVRRLHPDLSSSDGEDSARQLATALRLFDWTIRNVQLMKTPDWPAGDELLKVATAQEVTEDSWPPSAGAVGPGYQRYAWQALTYGKGDRLDRAELFTLLCTHANLDSAILAFPAEEGATQPYVEWLPAVMIDGKLFLFDTLLGLPLPGERPGSIATLKEVQANPDLIRKLDLSVEESIDKMDYWVQNDQLANVFALVNGPPESQSKRMAILESKLTGDYRLNLTMDAEALAERISSHDSISEVNLWHVPFSEHDFRDELQAAVKTIQFDPNVVEKVRWFFDEEFDIDDFVAFRAAKNLYLHGRFEKDRNDPQPSAITQFFDFMYSDEEIEQIETNTILQAQLGIFKKANQPVMQWRQLLASMKLRMDLVRADSAFYLSLCHYENGYPPTALKWLQRNAVYDEKGRWSEYIGYQIGRANEAKGDFASAAKAYEVDTASNQRHGNLIRKRWMDALIGT